MDHASSTKQPGTPPRPVNRADYWVGVFVLIFVAAFFITVTAICYGIIVTPPSPPGKPPRIAFPWIGWFTAMLTAPALILGFAQYVAGKKSEETGTQTDEKETAWAGQLPQRALRLYRIIRDAPVFMVCTALIALGATLLVIDGAFSLVSAIILALIPYAPYFIGGITLVAVTLVVIMAWFRHAANRLAAEYAFRREVLDKTGVILLNEKGKAILPPGGDRDRYAIGSINEIAATAGPLIEATPVHSLPQGHDQPEEDQPSRPQG